MSAGPGVLQTMIIGVLENSEEMNVRQIYRRVFDEKLMQSDRFFRKGFVPRFLPSSIQRALKSLLQRGIVGRRAVSGRRGQRTYVYNVLSVDG